MARNKKPRKRSHHGPRHNYLRDPIPGGEVYPNYIPDDYQPNRYDPLQGISQEEAFDIWINHFATPAELYGLYREARRLERFEILGIDPDEFRIDLY